VILGRVIGNAVATVKHRCFEGKSVLVIQPVGMDGRTPKGRSFLSVDSVQAGQGDLVLVAREGNCARQVLGNDDDPLHSVILGIVDDLERPGDGVAVGARQPNVDPAGAAGGGAS
jgi:microcompartment protein CcmK/EutM